jgi:hypothetical protein
MKHLLAAVATAVLASVVSMVPGVAAASVSFAVYQSELPWPPGSCSTPTLVIARSQSASFYGPAVGAGILADTICFTGPVGTSNASDAITGGTWSMSGQGVVRGTKGNFCPSGTIRWDASGLRATVIAPATVDASPCGAASPAMVLRGTWTRSPLTPNSSTFVGTLMLTR